MGDSKKVNGGAEREPARAEDVPEAARAQFAALCRVFAAGAALLVPLVSARGRIVYSIGGATDTGEFVPLSVILSPRQVDALRVASRGDLAHAGHVPETAPRIVLPN